MTNLDFNKSLMKHIHFFLNFEKSEKESQRITRCSARRSFIRPQKSNPEQLGQVWTQHLSLIQL